MCDQFLRIPEQRLFPGRIGVPQVNELIAWRERNIPIKCKPTIIIETAQTTIVRVSRLTLIPIHIVSRNMRAMNADLYEITRLCISQNNLEAILVHTLDNPGIEIIRMYASNLGRKTHQFNLTNFHHHAGEIPGMRGIGQALEEKRNRQKNSIHTKYPFTWSGEIPPQVVKKTRLMSGGWSGQHWGHYLEFLLRFAVTIHIYINGVITRHERTEGNLLCKGTVALIVTGFSAANGLGIKDGDIDILAAHSAGDGSFIAANPAVELQRHGIDTHHSVFINSGKILHLDLFGERRRGQQGCNQGDQDSDLKQFLEHLSVLLLD
jgi:hypothetical protein